MKLAQSCLERSKMYSTNILASGYRASLSSVKMLNGENVHHVTLKGSGEERTILFQLEKGEPVILSISGLGYLYGGPIRSLNDCPDEKSAGINDSSEIKDVSSTRKLSKKKSSSITKK